MTDIEEKIAKAEEEIRQLQNRKRKLLNPIPYPLYTSLQTIPCSAVYHLPGSLNMPPMRRRILQTVLPFGTAWRKLRKPRTHSLQGRLKLPCP